jgi:hypothetical protein
MTANTQIAEITNTIAKVVPVSPCRPVTGSYGLFQRDQGAAFTAFHTFV